MAKKKSGRRGGGGGGGGGGGKGRDESWSSADHFERKESQLARQDKRIRTGNTSNSNKPTKQERSRRLAHDTQDKRENQKVRLHLTKTKRELESLKERMKLWDDVAEQQKQEEENEKKRRLLEQQDEPKKKKKSRRLGPETWKLRGAARPAWQVYDFDTRYIDPYLQQHAEARAKYQRSRNLFSVYAGNFGIPTAPIACRQYLALLMRCGLLCMDLRQFKKARAYFVECMDLDKNTISDKKKESKKDTKVVNDDDDDDDDNDDEGVNGNKDKDKNNSNESNYPITTARCWLMRLYLEANRPDSARRLWERLGDTERSVWIRYAAALVEYVSWKLLQEPGSSAAVAQQRLEQALETNVFCGYYLAFYQDGFVANMEYTEEIDNATEPLQEAIEYCNSEQRDAWQETEGALEWLRRHLQTTRPDWRKPLLQLEQQQQQQEQQQLTKSKDDNDNNDAESNDTDKRTHNEETGDKGGDDDDDEDPVVDVLMYAGMFRTCMEMLEEQGSLRA